MLLFCELYPEVADALLDGVASSVRFVFISSLVVVAVLGAIVSEDAGGVVVELVDVVVLGDVAELEDVDDVADGLVIVSDEVLDGVVLALVEVVVEVLVALLEDVASELELGYACSFPVDGTLTVFSVESSLATDSGYTNCCPKLSPG